MNKNVPTTQVFSFLEFLWGVYNPYMQIDQTLPDYHAGIKGWVILDIWLTDYWRLEIEEVFRNYYCITFVDDDIISDYMEWWFECEMDFDELYQFIRSW